MTAKYRVSLNVTQTVSVEVEAEGLNSAAEKAYKRLEGELRAGNWDLDNLETAAVKKMEATI